MQEKDLEKVARLAASVAQTPMACVFLLSGKFASEGLGTDTVAFLKRELFPKLIKQAENSHVPAITGYSELKLNRVQAAFAEKAGLHFFSTVPVYNQGAGLLGFICVFDKTNRTLQAPQLEALKNLEFIFAKTFAALNRNSGSGTKRLLERKFASLSYYYKAFLNGTDYGVILLDTKGMVKVFNTGAEKMLQYSASEIIDKQSVFIFHQADELYTRLGLGSINNQSDFNKYIQKPSEGISQVNDWTFVKKNGEQIVVQLSVSAIRNELKEIIGYLAIAEDITGKRRTQEALRLSEERHRFFFENSQGLMVSHDMKGNILALNAGGASILGYKPEELTGKNLLNLTHQRNTAEIERYYQSITDVGYASGLAKLKHKDGTLRVLYYKNVKIGNGSIAYVIGNAVDLSSRIEMEKNLKRAKAFAEKANMAKDQFLANMSHEIRTPMNAIIGFNNILLNSALNNDQKECVEAIKMAGENLLGIINDILDFSKIQSGKLSLEKSTFNIHSLISNTCQLLSVKANEKGISLSLSKSEQLPEYLISDPLRLNQILLNLIGNAIKFTDNGKVEVSVSLIDSFEKQCKIRFLITDTGIGIPGNQLETIFERFTQASGESTRRFGGTGLGLSISKSLVEMLGGRLSVKSQVGMGSVFSFELELEKGIAPEINSGNTFNAAEKPGTGIKVLLVEDNELNQKLAKRVLISHGFETEIAENGQIGLAMLADGDFDLVLMDLQMPVMDGYEATRQIRETLQSKIPIIAMTAHSLVGEREKCMQIGMDAYIAKPFNTEDLLTKILTFAKRGKPGKNPVLTATAGHFSLSGLKELSGGDKNFEREMIELFIEQVKSQQLEINNCLNNHDLAKLKQTCHKLRSALLTFGSLQSGRLLASIEYDMADTDAIEKVWREAEKLIKLTVEELQELLLKNYN